MNEQEQHWAGEAGDAYHVRSPGEVKSNERFFEDALRTATFSSVFEFGCGTGANLEAIRNILPKDARTFILRGFDINEGAVNTARAKGLLVDHTDLTGWARRASPHRPFDLVLTKGFLIHLPPPQLEIAYTAIDDTARRYVLMAEYYNPTPQEIPYRGLTNLLWRRPFASEFMARFPAWKVERYGFVWRGDVLYPQDDLTWFLLERQAS